MTGQIVHRRAYTLIDLMVGVAVLGILSYILSGAARREHVAGLAQLQRERASLLLEYEASRVAEGRAPDPEQRRRLMDALPDATLEQSTRDGLTVIEVTWKEPLRGPNKLVLAVFAKGERP